MTKIKLIVIGLIGFSLFLGCNSDQSTNEIVAEVEPNFEPENIAYSTIGEFKPGVLTDSVYTNSFFGFEITIPSDWDILIVNNEKKSGSDNTITADSTVKSKNPSEENYFQLLTLQKFGRIPLVNFMVEKIEPIPNVTNASEYLAYTENYILTEHAEGFPHFIGHSVIESSVGNRPFLNQTFSVDFEQSSQFQRNYCVQFDAYIFTIITHYGDQDQLDMINALLDQITWK